MIMKLNLKFWNLSFKFKFQNLSYKSCMQFFLVHIQVPIENHRFFEVVLLLSYKINKLIDKDVD